MDRGDNSLPHRDRSSRGVVVPARRAAPATPKTVAAKPEPSTHPKDLAQVRESLGFDDIPVDALDSRSMRDILGAWITQAFHFKHPDNKAGRVYQFFRDKKFQTWKEDLKWALQADMEDTAAPKKPTPKPPVQSPAHPTAVHRAAPPTQPLHPAASHAASKSVEININFGSMPKLPSLPKLSPIKTILARVRNFRWTRNRIIIVSAVAVIVIGGSIAWRTIPGLPGSTKSNPGAITSTTVGKTPEYGTLAPGDKSIESLGGWHRVSPPGKEAVFAYADKIGDVTVNVSQQPVPKTFKPDVDKHVEELAKGYAATHKIESDSQTIYVGTSAQGPQSVILVKDDLLILMKSTAKIDDKAWSAYVESLK